MVNEEGAIQSDVEQPTWPHKETRLANVFVYFYY